MHKYLSICQRQLSRDNWTVVMYNKSMKAILEEDREIMDKLTELFAIVYTAEDLKDRIIYILFFSNTS